MATEPSYFSKLLESLCGEIGAELTLEPAFERAGFITFANGRRRFFKGTNFDLNGSAAAQIAQDKDFCAKFLRMAGVNCPESKVGFAPKCIAKWKAKNPGVAAALDPFSSAGDAARDWGFPLFVKPNEGAEGEGVLMVQDADQLKAHLEHLYKEHDRVLIQRPAIGDDFRLVVLDGAMLLAYQRVALAVTGNGEDTISQLLARRSSALSEAGRHAIALTDDPRISAYLNGQGLSLDHCPEVGETVRLLANANLSAGGDVLDVTESVAEGYRDLARAAASAVGLRFAGVDLLCADIEKFDPDYCVLEVNAAPGLNNYAALNKTADQRVTGLYRSLLQILQREAGADGN